MQICFPAHFHLSFAGDRPQLAAPPETLAAQCARARVPHTPTHWNGNWNSSHIN
jgi:hypothetical protein